jgi:hypothetical protein
MDRKNFINKVINKLANYTYSQAKNDLLDLKEGVRSLRMTDNEFNEYKKTFDKLNKKQMKAIGELRRKHHMFGSMEDLVRDFKITLTVRDYGAFVSVNPIKDEWIRYEITSEGKLIKE